MEISQRVLELALALPALLSALTVHEFAHAWAGNRLGDDTARRMGRLTLDPLAHLDPLGTCFMLFAFFNGFVVGWAKPVPFNPRNLSNPRIGGMLIALAGPISNLLQAPLWLCGLLLLRALVARGGGVVDVGSLTQWQGIVGTVLLEGFVVNIMLAAFNMIPLPPLDGHYVLEALGPPFITDLFNQIRPYGFIILIVLLNVPHLFASVMGPVEIFANDTAARALGYPS